MRIGKIINNDLANGDGVRTTVFVSGCPIKCPGCHNPELQDFEFGTEFTDATVEQVIALLQVDGITRGLSILGGEPLADQNLEGVAKLVTEVRKALPDCSIWVWTGYNIEERAAKIDSLHQKNFYDILYIVDMVVDGPFIESLKPGVHPWRGSSNQRLINFKSYPMK